ncbi:hypothetical protein [Rhodococcus opacus]|uniref:hypothetical protein n=1 Tax=Rhodococcus opacus TaxID=37919 RepID=UPI00046CB767|nr:hypothetical protein [Rhodococcus opacus]UDG94363.1 hypothetical protein K2Z90_004389 [Rhodococcus opacus PD630]
MSESNTQPAGQSVLKQKTPADPSPQPERGIPQHSELAFPGVLLGAAFVVGVFGALAIMLTGAASVVKGEVGQTYSEQLASAGENDVLARILWALGDMTESQSYIGDRVDRIAQWRNDCLVGVEGAITTFLQDPGVSP